MLFLLVKKKWKTRPNPTKRKILLNIVIATHYIINSLYTYRKAAFSAREAEQNKVKFF